MSTADKISIGIDIGGTFTDAIVLRESNGSSRVAWSKTPSTPGRPVEGLLRAVENAIARVDAAPAELTDFLHATTVGTNAILEEKGAKLGILMTEGFEDTLEIGRQKRSKLYEVFLEPETPGFLAPRDRRLGVRERIGYDGEVLIQLDEDELEAQIAELDKEGVEAVAVCYLFSFENPEHESRTRELLEALDSKPGISLSHEINPVFREYERLCATAFDAYVRPVMENYLGRLITSLREWGYEGHTVQTMQSRGGLASTRGALKRPGTTILSGPAAGVIGARFVGEAAGLPRLITLDMGGTSADIAVVAPNKALTSTEGRVGRYPLNIPMIDVQTIGAGGGGIAWLDGAGGLRVGPQSAGSDPGPACYGSGGENATVTDASLVLGYLNADYFLGGQRGLDVDAATAALERIAGPLGLSVTDTALGIHRITNAKMADAIRLASIKQGHDVRRFSLMVFGGAGPVSGAQLADDLGIHECVVPRAPGVLSALGLLVSNVEYDHAQTFLHPLDTADTDRMTAIYEGLAQRGAEQMLADGYSLEECVVHYSADMRFVGQSSELELGVSMPVRPSELPNLRAAFEREHERVYGHAPLGQPIEFVVLRAVQIRAPRPQSTRALRTDAALTQPGPVAARPGEQTRECTFAEGKFETRVLARDGLTAGSSIEGPAIVEQEDTTIVIPPRCRATVDDMGNLRIAMPGKGSQ